MELSSSSSKVTVEYFDPSGLFPLIKPSLLARLPLRNLHWKSPSRPLRSISSLHVDLVPYGQLQQRSQSPPGTSPGLSRTKSNESAQGIDDTLARAQSIDQIVGEQKTIPEAGVGTFKGPIKERRHQIPGLRQTPYLKVYILRCDDNDAYKATARKQLREWIKEHAMPTSQSTTSVNGQENHDAYEWLIVHVVLPNTVAATQPRTSGSSGNGSGSGTEKVSGASRWPGRGTSTLLDKIRSDFNGSSKTSKDRAAQLRVPKDAVPSHMFPEPSAASKSFGETPQEQENAWSDLISKFKSLILASFDLRVSQYEEDIRERDAQRSLPGWNFCTFFVLKEGLARGFESVGLVEDALVGYDELAVGLDAIIREQASEGSGEGHGGTFLSYTEDLRRQAEAARAAAKKQSDEEVDSPEDDLLTSPPLSATKKPYRDLILSNNISIFDFRCYLFARQLALLLRLGNAVSSRSELMTKLQDNAAARSATQKGDEPEDLVILAEVCRRGIEFITSVARIMRSDLWNAYSHADKIRRKNGEQQSSNTEQSERDQEIGNIIDNLVSSWTFSLSQQILAETSTKSITIPTTSVADANSSSSKMSTPGGQGQEQKVAIPEPKTIMHPARTSSLTVRQHVPEPLSPGIFPSGMTLSTGDGAALPSGSRPPASKTGLEDLAAHRAELYLLCRTVLEHLGFERNWFTGWQTLSGTFDQGSSAMEEICLDDDDPQPNTERYSVLSKTASPFGIKNDLLKAALKDRDSFYNLFESLTDKALRHYILANRTKSMDRVTADMAVLKFHLGDFATAASYFHRMAPFYAEGGWSLIETSMLTMYAKCLKGMDRREDYVAIILKLLAKAVAREKHLMFRRGRKDTATTKRISGLRSEELLEQDVTPTDGYIADLASLSKDLSYEVTVQMSKYFDDIKVEPYCRHFEDRDGFQLQLSVRHVLEDELEAQSAKVRIVGVLGGQGREIWLESSRPVLLKRGVVKVWVDSNVAIPGSYIVDKILLECHKVVFVHETLSKGGASTPTGFSGSLSAAALSAAKKSRIVYYSPLHALDAGLRLPKFIHLDMIRSIEINISSGWNNVSKGELRVRCASAGLRLRTADATVVEGNLKLGDKSKPGIVSFANLPLNSTVVFRIPYVLESDLSEIAVKIEVAYTTEKGEFLFATTSTKSIVLPLGVIVQDIFKKAALFSKFTLSAATHIPLRVVDARLDGSDIFEATSGLTVPEPMLVFPRQPASFIYRVVRHSKQSRQTQGTAKNVQKALALTIGYRCLDEEVEDALRENFVHTLTGSSLGDLSRLLMPTLLSGVQRRSAHELETIGLLGEINVGSFQDMKWDDALHAIPAARKQKLETWLVKWHEKNPVIQLSRCTAETVQKNREIVIPVEVPQVQVVHTADLRILKSDVRASSGVGMAAVGQMLAAELHITHTRVWDTGKVNSKLQSSSDARYTDADCAFEFFYEVHANPDHWLIGGRRRVHFSAKENELHKFPVVLLPLRAGHLLLPTIEIKSCLTQEEPADIEDAANAQSQAPTQLATPTHLEAPGRRRRHFAGAPANRDSSPHPPAPALAPAVPSITCETDFCNQGETILVLPNVKSTTVTLDPAQGGGAWLVESEKRIGGIVG